MESTSAPELGPSADRSEDFCVPMPGMFAQPLMVGCPLKGMKGPKLALAQPHPLLPSSFQQSALAIGV